MKTQESPTMPAACPETETLQSVLHTHGRAFADIVLLQCDAMKYPVTDDEKCFTYRMFELAAERIWKHEPHDRRVTPEAWMAHFKVAVEEATQ